MYVQETLWFKKQQRKTVWLKGVKRLVMCLILVLSVLIGIWCVPLNARYFSVDAKKMCLQPCFLSSFQSAGGSPFPEWKANPLPDPFYFSTAGCRMEYPLWISLSESCFAPVTFLRAMNHHGSFAIMPWNIC